MKYPQMAKKTLKLHDSTIRSAKPGHKPYKLADGQSLYLLVNPNGSRYWRQKYRLAGKEKLLALGVYPTVGLADARKAANKAREYLKADRDPAQHRKEIRRIAGTARRLTLPHSQSQKRQPRQIELLSTDSGYVVLPGKPIPASMKAELRALLPYPTDEQFDAFFSTVRNHADAYRTHRATHTQIATRQQQLRYFKTIEITIAQFNGLAEKLSILLDQAPFELKRKATDANISVQTLKDQLCAIPLLINDLEPSKSKFRAEAPHLARMLASAYEKHLGVKPVVRAFREKDDVPARQETAVSFTSVFALLSDLALDTAYRVAKSTMPA